MSVMGKYDPCDDCKKICCSICRMKELETELTVIQREIEDGTLVRVVRCGECVYSEPLQLHADLYNEDLMSCTCQHGEEAKNVWHKYTKQYKDYSLVEPDDFCSFGEKPVVDGERREKE